MFVNQSLALVYVSDKICRTFGEANNAKAQQTQVDGPQQRLGTEQRLMRGWRAGKQWENG